MTYLCIYLAFMPIAVLIIRYYWETLGLLWSHQKPGDDDGWRLFGSIGLGLIYPLIIPLYSLYIGHAALAKLIGKRIREMQKKKIDAR